MRSLSATPLRRWNSTQAGWGRPSHTPSPLTRNLMSTVSEWRVATPTIRHWYSQWKDCRVSGSVTVKSSYMAAPPPYHVHGSRNWVEISRSALRHNLEYVRPRLPVGTALCAIVKADAYGHGAVACAQVFCGAGVEWLAVTSVEEGARLRAAGIEARILVLAGFTAAEAGAIVAHRLTPAVWDPAQVRWLAAAAKAQGGAALAIHVKLETGMGRLGATAEQLPELEAALRAAPQLEVESVFSHLAASEAADPAPCERQRDRLLALAGTRRWHLLNSE